MTFLLDAARRRVLILVCAGMLCVPVPIPCETPTPEKSTSSAESWTELEPGLELAELEAPLKSPLGDSIIRILRIDPERFDLELLNASATADGRPKTAKAWSREHGLVAAINTSMYQQDHRTSVSLMRTRDHVNNGRLSKDNAVLAFDRLDPGVPPVQIIDRKLQDFEALRSRYGTLIQSIRMVTLNRENVWQQQPKRWSIATIGMDRRGHVLFIHCRSPYSVHDFIDMLLELPIDLNNAMYVEGGPEAQLYVESGDRSLELFGSFETGFFETDDNIEAWPIPNVVGVVRR